MREFVSQGAFNNLSATVENNSARIKKVETDLYGPDGKSGIKARTHQVAKELYGENGKGGGLVDDYYGTKKNVGTHDAVWGDQGLYNTVYGNEGKGIVGLNTQMAQLKTSNESLSRSLGTNTIITWVLLVLVVLLLVMMVIQLVRRRGYTLSGTNKTVLTVIVLVIAALLIVILIGLIFGWHFWPISLLV
jgi:hypothetical protein